MGTSVRPEHVVVRRILLAADDSPGALRARTLLGTLRLENARVRVLRALGPLPTSAGLPDSLRDELIEGSLSSTRTEIASFAEPLKHAGAQVESTALAGRAASAIVLEAERWGADLVVLGSHGRGALASAILGSVAAEVADHSPCSVLVARTDRVSRIVLADDGSRDAIAAATLVGSGLFDATVRVVSVAHVPMPISSGVSINVRAAVRDAQREALAVARKAHAEFAQRTAHGLQRLAIDATADVREGEPADEIVRAAEDAGADLIVLGTRGMTGLRRLLLGSVARNVLYRAKCSVLIARAAS